MKITMFTISNELYSFITQNYMIRIKPNDDSYSKGVEIVSYYSYGILYYIIVFLIYLYVV